MKIKNYLLALITIFLINCNSDDEVVPKNEEPKLLVTKEQEFNEQNVLLKSKEYTYDGAKLVSIKFFNQPNNSLDYESKFTYTGNLITLIESFNSSSIYQKKELIYDAAQRLQKFKVIELPAMSYTEETFLYNSDGTIEVRETTNVNPNPFGFIKLFVSNNCVIKEEFYTLGTLDETVLSTFDGKNSPYKNILGLDKLLFVESTKTANTQNFINNRIFSTRFYEYTHVYNSLNYPERSNQKYTNNNLVTNTYVLYTY